MKINRSFGIFVLFMALMMGSFISQPSQAASSGMRPVQLVAPKGDVPLFGWLKNSMIPIIYGMKDANFR